MECVRSSRSLFYLRLRNQRYDVLLSPLPPSFSLPPPNLFPRPDTGFFYASVHEARLGRRGITYKKTLTIVRRSQLCCCAICTRTVRNLKILIVTGARVAQYRVTHAWPNWIVMNKTGVKNNYSRWVDIPFELEIV